MDMEGKRYFIVFYRAYKLDGGFYLGQLDVEAMPFLNRRNIVNHLKEANNKIDTILITGFNEVSKSDFEEWSR